MRYTAYHGSPGGSFDTFDPERSGSASGYDHAKGTASFTSSAAVASSYAEGEGFIGRFAFHLENPYELDDSLRPMGISALIRHARNLGHDGVVLRNCTHGAVSPGVPSDVFFVFDLSAPRLVEVLQSDPEQACEPEWREEAAPEIARPTARRAPRRQMAR